ncbi:hypothetical protein [Aeromonas enteropelogenes]|uniref:hypothetical protein n=1 Tax=Aeromonas enteropelogenes TaxID=29489 RepID=UPI003B9FD2A2
MRILLSDFFKTLSSRVNKDIRESLYENEIFLSNRWDFIEKSIVRWSTYYKKYILLTLVLVGLVTCNLIIWQPWIKHHVIQYAPNWKHILELQGTFLGGQLTIIGVVYPLVVGLISILFQHKSAKNIIFPLYQKYSGFMFAGLSGLMLSGFIVVGYFLKATVSDSTYAAICITSAFWFLSNLLLTAWFFVKTFIMLNEKSREIVVFQFSINEACEFDIRRRMKQVILSNAVDFKLIDNPYSDVLDVLTHDYYNDENKKITRKVKQQCSIKNVHLWLLNSAIRIQIFILKSRKIKGGKIIIKPALRNRSRDIINIATYSGFEMNILVKILIKISFSFEKDEHQTNVGLLSVLNAFIGPAYDAIRNGDAREFSNALDSISLWHSTLASVLSFKNDNGIVDNWLILPDSSLFSRNYLDELISEYYHIARETVQKIPDNAHFYQKMLRFHRRLFSRRDSLIKQELKALIQASYYMWYLLVEWRSYNSESNDLRIANKYEDILYDFVGAWESWLMYIEPRSKRTGDINTVYPAFITHLECTASTTISALRFGNFEAAGWGVDMLNNWFELLSRDDHWQVESRWRTVLINISFLPMDSTSNIWKLILKENSYNYSAAFDLSFKNAHIDLRIITACYMLLKPDNDKPELLAKYVKALLSGERIHPSGFNRQCRNTISNAGDLLGAYIRHRDYGYGTYEHWLSSIMESFGRIYEERRVSGRIYSGWGANDPQSMNRAYVEIAISMSSTLWMLPHRWDEALSSGFFGYEDKQRIISDLNEWIEIANEDHTLTLVEPDNIETYKNHFIKSLENIISKIIKSQNTSISDAEIDKELLIKFGIVSSFILKKENAHHFPLGLFEHIVRDALPEDSSFFEIRLSNYNKEQIACNLNASRAINEESWMSDFISESIKSNILSKLLTHPYSELYRYTDIDSTLSGIIELSKLMACPVLFVGHQNLKDILYSSLYELEIARKYGISHQDGFDSEYICHIGGYEVYSLEFDCVDYCLLTSKELFDTIGVHNLGSEQYVDVSFELNDSSSTIGSLIFKYWMTVTLANDTPCIKLELQDSNNKKNIN